MGEQVPRELIMQAQANVPTDWGIFRMSAFSVGAREYAPHMMISHPEVDPSSIVTVRIHSECMTGDIFHSKKCDCGEQLHSSMEVISKEKGVLLYLRQEGRGIGIINKLKAYELQEKGLDTIAANEALGLDSDYRRYGVAARMLQSLGITKVRLLTNNPEKIQGLESSDIEVVERLPLIIAAQPESAEYLKTKAESMGHLLNHQ